MTATRLLFRLALRSLARRKARTALLVAAIFLPLTMAVTASVLATTSQPTAEAATEQRLGQAGALLVNQELVGSDGVDAALRSAESALAESLGREVPLVPEVTTPLPARLGDREVASYGHGLDLDEEIHQGRYLLVEGRHARRGGEVAVSVEVADRLDLAVGSTVQLGGRREEAIVTGIVSDAGSTTRSFVVVDVATAANHSPEATRGEENATGSTYAGTVAWYAREEIVQTPELAAAGWQVRSRGDALLDHGHPGSEGAGSLLLVIAAAVVAETTLVIFAVFTVVVRSTARESALLAAAGADPAARRRVVTYQGVLLGLAATVAAVLVGVLAARLLSDPFAASQGQIWGPIRLDPVQIGLLLLLGLSAPVVAARTAAEPAARLDVAAALHGGDLPGSSGGKGFRPALTAGLVGSALALASGGALLAAPPLVAGAALLLVVAAGTGMGALTSRVARFADRLPLVARLGARSAARTPSRTTAVAVVLVSTTVLAGVVLVGMGALTRKAEDAYVPQVPHGSMWVTFSAPVGDATLAALAEAAGTDEVIPLRPARTPPDTRRDHPEGAGALLLSTPVEDCVDRGAGDLVHVDDCLAHTGYPQWRTEVVVTPERHLPALLDRPATEAELSAFRRGAVLVLDDRLHDSGTATARVEGSESDGSAPDTLDFEAVHAPVDVAYAQTPMALLSASAAADRGLIWDADPYLVYVPAEDITRDTEDRVRALLTADVGQHYGLGVERGPEAQRVLATSTVVAALALAVLGGTLALVATALSVSETRRELATLAAVGASRRFRGAAVAAHASAVTATSVGLGLLVVVALAPAVVLALEGGWSVLPWWGLLGAALSCWCVATLAAYLGSRWSVRG